MNDVQIGRALSVVRHALRLRQADVGERAGVDQKVVSLLEGGLLERVSLARFRRVCAVLDIQPVLTVRWRSGELDRLIDRVHAELVEVVSAVLAAAGWQVIHEFTFNVYGERGSVDILAWHPIHRALLIIEVKSRLTDLQAMLMSMSRKVRLVPPLVAKERDWARLSLGRILVVDGSRANRTVVDRHRATFAATFPASTRDVGRWLSNPAGDFAGMWFVAPRPGSPTGAARFQPSSRTRARGSRTVGATRSNAPERNG